MLDPETARTYLDEHKVEEAIAAAVAQVIRERPADPVALVGKILQTKSASALSTISWNIAAINNNPFEYWLTHPDPAYAKLMEDVENFVEAPGDTDVPVGEVFTPAMFDELDALMTAQGWDCAEQCRAAYASLAERTIIAGFMKDAELGNKRLMSMPDRMTNTIDLVGGGLAFRPTVISSFAGEMSTVATWWAAWKDFLFAKKLELPDKKSGGASSKLPAALLSKIPRSKYPALTEEDEAMSVRLQTVCLAIFDAILVHMLNQLSPGGKWLEMKLQILEALLTKKEDKTIGVLTGPYAGTHVLFLQEVRTAAAKKTLPAALSDHAVIAPAKASKADQNSVIALSTAKFDVASALEVTAKAMELLPAEGSKPSDGDLLVVSVSDVAGKKYLFASFHGDTDGLATAPTLHAVHALWKSMPGYALFFGLDANTYAKAKPGKQAAVTDFLDDVGSKGLVASSGSEPFITTYNARTFLQPQLQKACKAGNKKAKGDFNPKDFILYAGSEYELVDFGADNTGKRAYTEEMVIPTLDWPSDHGLIFTTVLSKD